MVVSWKWPEPSWEFGCGSMLSKNEGQECSLCQKIAITDEFGLQKIIGAGQTSAMASRCSRMKGGFVMPAGDVPHPLHPRSSPTNCAQTTHSFQLPERRAGPKEFSPMRSMVRPSSGSTVMRLRSSWGREWPRSLP